MLADFFTDVTISEDNLNSIEIVVENEPTKGYLRLSKTDSLNGLPIASVQFDIYDASGALAGTMTTDENGVAVSPALPKGSYIVREHENPTGYVADLIELPAVVNQWSTKRMVMQNSDKKQHLPFSKQNWTASRCPAFALFDREQVIYCQKLHAVRSSQFLHVLCISLRSALMPRMGTVRAPLPHFVCRV